MTSTSIVGLIMTMAPMFGIDPYIALSVAYVESNLNPKVIGTKGEVGIFQIMPNVYKARGYTTAQMKLPLQNIYVGLDILKEAKQNCIHKGALTSLVCYNAGAKNAKKIKHPNKFIYVVKVTRKMLQLMSLPEGI